MRSTRESWSRVHGEARERTVVTPGRRDVEARTRDVDCRRDSVLVPRVMHWAKAWAGLLVGLAGCGTPSPYGYARTYVPSNAETQAQGKARDLDLVMAQRQPEQWAAQPVSFHGVVSRVVSERQGVLEMELSLRRLERRNLCRDASADSCRVTVSEKTFGTVRVKARTDPASEPVQAGSLLRVIGRFEPPTQDSEPPSVDATFYRHWPAEHYVTTAARKYMRR